MFKFLKDIWNYLITPYKYSVGNTEGNQYSGSAGVDYSSWRNSPPYFIGYK